MSLYSLAKKFYHATKKIFPKWLSGFIFNIYDWIKIKFGYLKHYRIHKGDIVFDLGAETGSFGIYAAKRVGKAGKVYLFEPNPEMYEFLLSRKEKKPKKFQNIIISNFGISDTPGILPFVVLPNSEASYFLRPGEATEDKIIKNIEVKTIDQVVEEFGLLKVDLIKMDIEGFEIQAVRGMPKTIKNSKPNLSIAAYHRVNGKQTCEILPEMLNDDYKHVILGFKIHKTIYAFD